MHILFNCSSRIQCHHHCIEILAPQGNGTPYVQRFRYTVYLKTLDAASKTFPDSRIYKHTTSPAVLKWIVFESWYAWLRSLPSFWRDIYQSRGCLHSITTWPQINPLSVDVASLEPHWPAAVTLTISFPSPTVQPQHLISKNLWIQLNEVDLVRIWVNVWNDREIRCNLCHCCDYQLRWQTHCHCNYVTVLREVDLKPFGLKMYRKVTWVKTSWSCPGFVSCFQPVPACSPLPAAAFFVWGLLTSSWTFFFSSLVLRCPFLPHPVLTSPSLSTWLCSCTRLNDLLITSKTKEDSV